MAEPETKESILKSVRDACAIDPAEDSFDTELLMHINNALATLYQNGVGKATQVTAVNKLWSDVKDPAQVKGNDLFEMAKTYVFVKTKILFDPPPPSNVKYMDDAANETLWRLREQYKLDEREVTP